MADETKESKQPCDHQAANALVKFDLEAARKMPEWEVRQKFPRYEGPCPTCGELLICYASTSHYILGDW